MKKNLGVGPSILKKHVRWYTGVYFGISIEDGSLFIAANITTHGIQNRKCEVPVRGYIGFYFGIWIEGGALLTPPNIPTHRIQNPKSKIQNPKWETHD